MQSIQTFLTWFQQLYCKSWILSWENIFHVSTVQAVLLFSFSLYKKKTIANNVNTYKCILCLKFTEQLFCFYGFLKIWFTLFLFCFYLAFPSKKIVLKSKYKFKVEAVKIKKNTEVIYSVRCIRIVWICVLAEIPVFRMMPKRKWSPAIYERWSCVNRCCGSVHMTIILPGISSTQTIYLEMLVRMMTEMPPHPAPSLMTSTPKSMGTKNECREEL